MEKSIGNLEDIDNDTLPKVLYDFYSEAKSRNSNDYAVQTLKCLRAGLNRHFRKE